MPQINLFSHRSLTAIVNEIKSPNRFLQRELYGNSQTYASDTIEIGRLLHDRRTAPFVRRGSEGIMVPGHTSAVDTISPANIRIKRPFTATDLLTTRRVGGAPIYVQSGRPILSQLQQQIARDMQVMADYITNSIEWLCAMALRHQIDYAVEDGEVFSVTFPRPNSMNQTLTVFWDDNDPTLPRPLADIFQVKAVMSEEVGLVPTDCLLGEEAALALMELVESGNVKMLGSDGERVVSGTIDFTTQFNSDGVIYLGTLGSVRFWFYQRTVTIDDGTVVPLIRPKFAEFYSNDPASMRQLAYGAIHDMAAVAQGLSGFMQERFSKSWDVQDPSARMILATSRPMPINRRPATVSVQVVE